MPEGTKKSSKNEKNLLFQSSRNVGRIKVGSQDKKSIISKVWAVIVKRGRTRNTCNSVFRMLGYSATFYLYNMYNWFVCVCTTTMNLAAERKFMEGIKKARRSWWSWAELRWFSLYPAEYFGPLRCKRRCTWRLSDDHKVNILSL